MTSARLCALVILSLLPGLATRAFPGTSPPQAAQPSAGAASSQPLLQYTLPPDKLEKAYALYLLNGTLYFVTTAWGLLVLYVMLRSKFGVRLRDVATRVSRFQIVQAAIVMSMFVVVLELLQLPFDAYEHHVSLKYGLSVQHVGILVRRLGEVPAAGVSFCQHRGMDSLLRATPQPAPLVVLLLVGGHSHSHICDLHRADLD